MTSRPKSSTVSNNFRRTTPVFDADRMKTNANILSHDGNTDFHGVPLSMNYLNTGHYPIGNAQPEPPALPPRADASRYNRYSAYSSMYSPYSRFSPSMFPYGSCRTPYNRYMPGMPHDSYNSFVQLAEESTRPAFESIESVVDVVSSISMMLESTYHAVYSSYNAILGVVEQFSRLRDHLAEVLSFLAVLRGLRYLCLKILYLLRLKKDNPSVEAAWNTAKSASEHSDFSQFHNDPKSPWPFFLFVGLVIGAPWLMFRLLAKSSANKPFSISSWKDKDGYYLSIANYSFNTTRRGELPFSAGETLYVAPKHLQARTPKGWLLACNKNNKVGFVPANYLKGNRTSTGTFRVVAQRKGSINPADTLDMSKVSTPKTDAVPEKSDKLPKNVPADPFVEEGDARDSDRFPVPSTSKESAVDHTEL